MELVLTILLLLVGFVLLIKGADFFVEGASSLARKLKIPPLIVGLTIVAMGTSAPELAVSISASVKGANELAVSNVIGSNIFNLLIVLGICALFKPVGVTKALLKCDYPVSIGATVLLFVFLMMGSDISRIESVVLLVIMVGYMFLTVKSALKKRSESSEEEETEKKFSAIKCALSIILGAAAIVFGGNMVVDNAEKIGLALGMSEALVGLTICAVGTSLPELVTSVAAAKKGETDMAMGNVIGSNIFNILLILGLSGAISPIAISPEKVANTLIDCGFYVVVCLLAYIFCLTGKRITRAEGAILATLYVLYMAFVVLRDSGVLSF